MGDAAAWNGNWAWSLPLIAVTVMFHVIGIGMINVRVIQIADLMRGHRHFVYGFALVIWARSATHSSCRARPRSNSSAAPGSRSDWSKRAPM